jgi:hypothetical protein
MQVVVGSNILEDVASSDSLDPIFRLVLDPFSARNEF